MKCWGASTPATVPHSQAAIPELGAEPGTDGWHSQVCRGMQGRGFQASGVQQCSIQHSSPCQQALPASQMLVCFFHELIPLNHHISITHNLSIPDTEVCTRILPSNSFHPKGKEEFPTPCNLLQMFPHNSFTLRFF